MKHFLFFTILFVLQTSQTSAQQSKIDSLEQVLKTSKEDTGKIITMNALVEQYDIIGDYDRAKQNAKDAIALGEKLSAHESNTTYRNAIQRSLANSYNDCGIICDDEGDYAEALENYFAAIRIGEKIGYKQRLPAYYSNIGIIYKQLGDYPEAMKYYFLAVKIKEEIGDRKTLGTSYANIAVLYSVQDKLDEALHYNYESLKLKEEFNDKRGIGITYNNIANILRREEKYDEAQKNNSLALKIFEELGDKRGLAASYANMANIFADQKNYEAAFSNLTTAQNLQKEIGDKKGVAESSNQMGELYYKKGELTQAINFLNQGLALSKEINYRDGMVESYEWLSSASSKMNDFKNAFEYHTLYSDLKDSLVNEKSNKQMAELQTIYQTEKKDNQIKLQSAQLEKDGVTRNFLIGIFAIVVIAGSIFTWLIIRRRKANFKKQISDVEMKALRAQMNPHFIFNALDNINAFVEANDKASASDYLIKFARLIRLILENSRQQEVLLEKDVETLRLYLDLEALRFRNKFDYKLNISSDIDEENTLVPPMILQPFVENAILHGLQPKEEKGTLEIFLKKENEQLICIVEDNGVGRLRSVEINTKKAHKSESLGMKITKERLDILSRLRRVKTGINIIDLFDEKNFAKGTRVEVLLPLRIAV